MKLQEEIYIARILYDYGKKKKKRKYEDALATRNIENLEDEVQQLKNRNKELTETLATRERIISEISDEIYELMEEKNNLAESYKRAVYGKLKANFCISLKVRVL